MSDEPAVTAPQLTTTTSSTATRLKQWTELLPAVWSVYLFVGGVTFVRYYFSISFMPTLDLSAAISLLAAAAMPVILLFAALGVYSAFPGSILKSFTEGDEFLLPGGKPSLRILPFLILPIILLVQAISSIGLLSSEMRALSHLIRLG